MTTQTKYPHPHLASDHGHFGRGSCTGETMEEGPKRENSTKSHASSPARPPQKKKSRKEVQEEAKSFIIS